MHDVRFYFGEFLNCTGMLLRRCPFNPKPFRCTRYFPPRSNFRHLPHVQSLSEDAAWVQAATSKLGVQIDAAKLAQELGEPIHEEQRTLLQANMGSLLAFLSPAEVKGVLSTAPRVLSVDLGAWFQFLEGVGFTSEQITYLLAQVGKRTEI